MYDNRLPADQIESLAPGDKVLIEVWPNGWRQPQYATATVARTTATQIVVERSGRNGGDPYEQRYRKKNAQAVGDSRSELVDPANPRTVEGFTQAKRRQRESDIDTLAYLWKGKREIDTLRRLHTAIGQHLDAES